MVLSDTDPVAAWDVLATNVATDAQIAEVLSAGIAIGIAIYPGFPRLVRQFVSEASAGAPPGSRQLPALRRLLWAMAVALAELETIEAAEVGER